MKPQSTTSTSSAKEVTFLKQRLQETDEKLKATDQRLQENDQAYAELKGQFQSLHNILLTLLPPYQQVLRQVVSNLTQSQQQHAPVPAQPTTIQPSTEQPGQVHPSQVQPNTILDPEDPADSDDYVDY